MLITNKFFKFFQMDGSMVSGIQLKVSLARRQPQIEPINDATSSSTWSTLGKISIYLNF